MKKFRKIRNKALSLTAAALITCTAAAPAFMQKPTVYAGQQLGQTDFDDGIGLPWHIVESGPSKMQFALEDGVYKITINNPGGASRGGEDRWDCQFRHRGLKIVSGHQYKVEYEITPSNSGKYYTKIGNLDGDVELWHNMMADNGPDFNSTWDLIQVNANETKKVSLTFTASQSLDVAEWAFHFGGDGQYTPGDCFPEGTVITFDNMSLIDLTSDENDYEIVGEKIRCPIMTNQAGYITGCAKRATLLSSSKKAVDFEILDDSGKSVYSGSTTPFGEDKDSGDDVHIIDFTDFDDAGTYTIETEDGEQSRKFTIGDSAVYSSLLYDALNYFYQNRSGIEIESQYISSGDKDKLARAAGHPTDNAEIMADWDNSATGKSIDVTGGWYDAGDHGKYVVNGGFSLWMMQNQYETALKNGYEKVYADGAMLIPENSNGNPDILDEARWEMEWMLRMIVQDGEYKNMAYHKAHDEKWTGLGIAPADDKMKRIVKPPSTAASLNLAACGAQSARLWEDLDPDFAKECLEAAENAYEAAKKNPDVFAPLDSSIGGGAYGDDFVDDEFYWAACELYLTTGDDSYYKDMKSSDFFLEVPETMDGGESVGSIGSFDWGHTAALGTMSLALSDNIMSSDDMEELTENILDTASAFIELEENQGYGLPYGQSKISYNDSDEGYIWGSNSVVADNAIVIAYAYMLSGESKYMDGVIGGMDYLLGRNAMDNSYVTGYGANAIKNPHHRFWANQIDETFPSAPDGVLSGGPNSGMQDPWVQGMGWKKGTIEPQKCYMDHIEAWSVNECTINWNASLAWLAGFTAQENGGIIVGETGAPVFEEDEITTEEAPEKTDKKNEEDKNEDKNNKSDETTSSADKDDKDDDKSEDEDDKGNIGMIALISGAVVIGLISIELFIYKLVKLKKK
ncbi:MAG: glycoside hydrolase family 9 protein [Ruminococcus sp.]|nr:glycoside hydrolase family 9 protein [Ruminococcus sp.]